jgi:hypothetical protein
VLSGIAAACCTCRQCARFCLPAFDRSCPSLCRAGHQRQQRCNGAGVGRQDVRVHPGVQVGCSGTGSSASAQLPASSAMCPAMLLDLPCAQLCSLACQQQDASRMAGHSAPPHGLPSAPSALLQHGAEGCCRLHCLCILPLLAATSLAPYASLHSTHTTHMTHTGHATMPLLQAAPGRLRRGGGHQQRPHQPGQPGAAVRVQQVASGAPHDAAGGLQARARERWARRAMLRHVD